MAWDWDTIALAAVPAVIAAIVSGSIGVVTIFLIRKQFGFLKEQHQIHGLVDAFNVLNTTRSRKSRRIVYELHAEFEENKNVRIFRGKKEVEDVRADFDVLGKLVRTDNINKDHFLHEFGPLAYRCWICLMDHIETEREDREFMPFMENFEWLANEAEEY
ncbi:MAG: DUF4760 domain-containing protein [Nitrososphaeraceae archaeon]